MPGAGPILERGAALGRLELDGMIGLHAHGQAAQPGERGGHACLAHLPGGKGGRLGDIRGGLPLKGLEGGLEAGLFCGAQDIEAQQVIVKGGVGLEHEFFSQGEGVVGLVKADGIAGQLADGLVADARIGLQVFEGGSRLAQHAVGSVQILHPCRKLLPQ